MKKKSTSLFMYALLFLNPFIVYSQSAIVKKINFTIKDAVSGRPIEGAQVTLKGLLKKTKTAGEDGSVNFEIPLIVSSTVAKFEISDGSIISGHKNQYIEITLRQGQDIYDYPITLKSDYKRVTISVTDEKLKTAIAGARVNLRGVRDTKDENALTDGGGIAFFDVLLMNKAQTIPVTVSKEGFENFTGNININERTDQYPLSVSLKKNKYTKILRVTVVNEKDGTPIPGTKVSADQSFSEIFSDQTGQDGVVDLVLTTGGSFKLLANAGNFEPAEKTIEINRLGDQEIYEEKFQLKKKEFMREMRVTVLEEIEPGQMKPKQGAIIYVNGVDQGTTGADGKLVFKHNKTMGDLIIVKASAYENDPETQNITVGGTDWRYFPPQYDVANFILKYKPSKIKLIVQVSDYITNKPIPLANTIIKSYAGNAVSETVQTNSQGEATLNIETKALRSDQYRLVTTATDYEDNWSDIPGYFLQPSGEDKIFTVYIKKKNTKVIRRDLYMLVREYGTLKPIPNASVDVDGVKGVTNSDGKAFFPAIFGISDILRPITVTATGYVQNQKNYRAGGGYEYPTDPFDEISIQLEKKPTIDKEIKYGPITVTPKDWVSTKLILPKGGSFRVEATGEYTSLSDKNFRFGPSGGNGWWLLVGKTGEQRFALGTFGSGTTLNGGLLELGTPRVMNFYDVDKADLQGSFIVYVFAKDAEQLNTTSTSNTATENKNQEIKILPKDTAANEKTKKALEHLGFLGKIFNGEYPGNRMIEEIIGEVRFIVSKYNLDVGKKSSDLEKGLNTIKLYYSGFGNVMPNTKTEFDVFLMDMMDELRAKIEKQQL